MLPSLTTPKNLRNPNPTQSEFAAKLERVRALLEEQGADGLLIGKQPSFSWLSCGGEAHVPLTSDVAVARLLVTKDEVHAIASKIEMPRLLDETLKGLKVTPHEHDWHDPNGARDLFRKIANPKKVLSDTGEWTTKAKPEWIAPLRWSFLPEEVKRYRDLGRDAEAAVNATCQTIEPGMSEFEIAGHLCATCWLLELTPVVVLIAVDERIRKYRHPLPTEKKLKDTAMVVLSARRKGQIVALTRLVRFEKVPPALRKRHRAVCAVDVAFQQGTQPGAKVKDVFKRGVKEYEDQGFGDEWHLHHQGGASGYMGREYLGSPKAKQIVRENQPFAWNPSIAGTKSEDTILATEKGIETVTASKNWPMLSVDWEGGKFKRPDILVL